MASSCSAFDLGLVQHQLRGVGRALQQVGRHVLELLARDRHGDRLAFVAEGDHRPRRFGQRDLGQVAIVAQHLHGLRRLPRIDAVLAPELLGHVVQQPVVPVDAAQLHVAVGRQHLEVRGRVLHHRHVERAAAQVVDQRQLGLGVASPPRRPAPCGPRRRSAWRPSAR